MKRVTEGEVTFIAYMKFSMVTKARTSQFFKATVKALPLNWIDTLLKSPLNDT